MTVALTTGPVRLLASAPVEAPSLFRDLTVAKATRQEGSATRPILQANLPLPEPLRPGHILSWNLGLPWVACYSSAELSLLDGEGRAAVVVTWGRGELQDRSHLSVQSRGQPVRAFDGCIVGFEMQPAERCNDLQSPHGQPRQYRLARLREGVILEVREGRRLVWSSSLLPLPERFRLRGLRLTVMDDQGRGWVRVEPHWNWLRFQSVGNAPNNFGLEGTLDEVRIDPVANESILDEAAARRFQAETPRRPKRAELPPIASPYFISGYALPQPPEVPAPLMKHLNMETSCGLQGRFHNLWLDRGAWPLLWSFGHAGPHEPVHRTLEGWTEYYLSLARQGWAGMAIDEIGNEAGEPEKVVYPLIFEACRRVKQRYPHFFIAIHDQARSPSAFAALKDGTVDLAIAEFYSYVPDPDRPPPDDPREAWEAAWEWIGPRVQRYRAEGVIEKVIPHLGHLLDPVSPHPRPLSRNAGEGRQGIVGTPQRLEYEVQRLREVAPEMPGICFYGHGDPHRPEVRALLRFADGLVEKYYLAPAPKVRIKLSQPAQRLRGGVAIRVEATRSAKGGTVRQYKIFVDDELRAQEQEWVWDTTQTAPGEHIITAHAISSDWLRGAAQVRARVERPNSR